MDKQASRKPGAVHWYPSCLDLFWAIDNALAESVIGLFKTEVINFLGPWKSMAQVEWETLQWVSWYNTERLHGAIGHRPPQEMEDEFYAELNTLEKAA